MQFQAELTN